MTTKLSLCLRRLLASQFTASDLRHIAWLMEVESPGMVAREQLSDASIDELAEMLTSGRRPTIGWWKRNTRVTAASLVNPGVQRVQHRDVA